MKNKTMKRASILLMYIWMLFPIYSQNKTNAWGDQGNGTYINPILNSDYSDPDVIRVGEKYYMVASDFHFIGMQILESNDMINWKLVAQLYDKFNFPEWEQNSRYAGGSWAPSLRYHDNKYWVFFCTPQEGLFMTNAENPKGPWTPLVHVEKVARWEDPCPFWDDDGTAYLGRSILGAGPIIIHKMSPDGTKLLDEGRTVYTGPIAEGTKIHKKDGYYYLSIPEGGVDKGWQTMLRSKSIYGPYEKKVVLEQGSTSINGPHQGAMVETSKGEWFFYHFQQYNPLGRVVHLQPMYWENGWPVIGIDIDMNGIGEPVYVWRKPDLPEAPIEAPVTNDEFNKEELGLQWQFNHNPRNEGWSLKRHKGMITFKTYQAENFKKARNTLTQKTIGYRGVATLKMHFKEMVDGQRCGLACMGRKNWLIGVHQRGNKRYIYLENSDNIVVQQPIKDNAIYLRMEADVISNRYQLSYSNNNKDYKTLGNPFSMKGAYWKGVRIAMYGYNLLKDNGCVSFASFEYEHDGPKAIGNRN